MSWNCILIGLRLWTVCAMACSCMTCFLHGPKFPPPVDSRWDLGVSLEPVYVLGACTVSVFVTTLVYYFKVDKTVNHTNTMRLHTRSAEAIRVLPGVSNQPAA